MSALHELSACLYIGVCHRGHRDADETALPKQHEFIFGEIINMTCSSTITIGGYPLDVMRRTYTVWHHFRPEDRIIRSRKRGQRNPHLQGVPTDPLEFHQLELDFAYSVCADVLRRRLGFAGFTLATLEKEYRRYYEAVCQCSGRLFFTGDPEAAAARADAFRAATLDDWLEALKETVNTSMSRVRRNSREVAEPANILVNIITGSDEPGVSELRAHHGLLGFPCSSLDQMAVALLEVTPGNAVCEQEVSMFVRYQGDTTFDDMRLRTACREPQRQTGSCQDVSMSKGNQDNMSFDDI
ncbi:HEPN/Toprim-associated domain-containing protein [Paraburkholderia metrosideri]|nr:HEPN/Toprim-associated domain-containing protein [Paraburkholderia metrosideri]